MALEAAIADIAQRGQHVRFVPIVLQKSFCITERNFPDRRRGDRIIMWGTTSNGDELTGDFGKRIASSGIIDWMGYLKQSGGPLLQMLKINNLLTLRSPNANDWRELDHHVGPYDATEVDAVFG